MFHGQARRTFEIVDATKHPSMLRASILQDARLPQSVTLDVEWSGTSLRDRRCDEHSSMLRASILQDARLPQSPTHDVSLSGTKTFEIVDAGWGEGGRQHKDFDSCAQPRRPARHATHEVVRQSTRSWRSRRPGRRPWSSRLNNFLLFTLRGFLNLFL